MSGSVATAISGSEVFETSGRTSVVSLMFDSPSEVSAMDVSGTDVVTVSTVVGFSMLFSVGIDDGLVSSLFDIS
jgi:hypothetical protein